MNKEEAERQAQELLNYYGSGKYQGYEEITMPDGSPGVRVEGCIPSVTDMFKDTEREIHFQNAAELLLQKLEQLRLSRSEQKTLIAQFLYDLAVHVVSRAHLREHAVGYPRPTPVEMIRDIPDLTEWTEQQRDV